MAKKKMKQELSEEQKAQIRDLWLDGASNKDISELTGAELIDVRIYIKGLEERKAQLMYGDEEIQSALTEQKSAMLSAIGDLNVTEILSNTLRQNVRLMNQAIEENDVQIYTARDLSAFQTSTAKLIDSYVNLLKESQAYDIQQRKIDEADANGTSLGDADIKKALLETLSKTGSIIDVDIPSLRK